MVLRLHDLHVLERRLTLVDDASDPVFHDPVVRGGQVLVPLVSQPQDGDVLPAGGEEAVMGELLLQLVKEVLEDRVAGDAQTGTVKREMGVDYKACFLRPFVTVHVWRVRVHRDPEGVAAVC